MNDFATFDMLPFIPLHFSFSQKYQNTEGTNAVLCMVKIVVAVMIWYNTAATTTTTTMLWSLYRLTCVSCHPRLKEMESSVGVLFYCLHVHADSN